MHRGSPFPAVEPSTRTGEILTPVICDRCGTLYQLASAGPPAFKNSALLAATSPAITSRTRISRRYLPAGSECTGTLTNWLDKPCESLARSWPQGALEPT